MQTDILGYIAAIGTTASFIPQVIKIYKEKSVKDISLGMYITFVIGIFFWLVYGFLLNSWPMIIANAITFVLSSIILYFKLTIKH